MDLELPSSVLKEERELCGKEFPSWDAFTTFFDDWCEQHRSIFRMSNPIQLTKSALGTMMEPDRVARLKYKHVRLICKNGVRSRLPRVLCQACINLRLNAKMDRLVISKCSFTHSHPLCPMEFAYYFRRGFLSANSHLPLPVRIMNAVSKQFLAMHDIRRLLTSCKTDTNGIIGILTALQTLFVQDPETKVKVVFVEDQPVVRTIFLMTSLMRSLCHRFPDLLIFDCMVGLNEAYDLFVLLCVDSDGRGQEGAYCLTQKGTPDLLRFTLVSLVQSLPDLKRKVRCLTVCMDIWDEKALTELLPKAQVHISRPQETLFSKAQEMGAPEDKTVWPLLCQLSSASSLKAYTSTIKEMKTIFPEKFMNYFHEQWHPHRKKWVNFWTFKGMQDISADELIRLLQQQLVASLRPSPSLVQGLVDLVAWQISKAKGLRDDEVVPSYQIFYDPGQVILIRKELDLARNGFFNIQGTVDGVSIKDGDCDFSINQKLTSCSCSISTDNGVPCRHIFFMHLRTGEALFNSNFLRKNTRLAYTMTEIHDLA